MICRKLLGDGAFPQNFHPRKLNEIKVLYAVAASKKNIAWVSYSVKL